MSANIEGKTFTVISQDGSGLILADVSNGWSGVGNSNLFRVSADSDDDQASVEVTALKDGKS